MLAKNSRLLTILGLIAAIALMASDRSANWLSALKPVAGLLWCALFVLPWFVAILRRSGDSFIAESVGRDSRTAQRAV